MQSTAKFTKIRGKFLVNPFPVEKGRNFLVSFSLFAQRFPPCRGKRRDFPLSVPQSGGFCKKELTVLGCGRRAAERRFFILYAYPFLPARHRLVILSEFRPPPLLLAEKKRSAPGWRRRRGFGADEDGPVLRQDVLVQGGYRVQIWYKLDLLQRPRPLPLARCSQGFAGFPRAPGQRQRKEKQGPCKSAPNGTRPAALQKSIL